MSYKHITINERCCIVEYLNLGWSLSKIAKELNRNKSSISREIKRNNLNGKYTAHIAQDKYEINGSSIARCCLRKLQSAGKHPITGEKLHWVYADEMNNSFVA